MSVLRNLSFTKNAWSNEESEKKKLIITGRKKIFQRVRLQHKRREISIYKFHCCRRWCCCCYSCCCRCRCINFIWNVFFIPKLSSWSISLSHKHIFAVIRRIFLGCLQLIGRWPTKFIGNYNEHMRNYRIYMFLSSCASALSRWLIWNA